MSSTVSPPSQSFVGFTNSQFHPPRKEKKREQFISLFLYSLFNLGSSMSLIYVMSLQLPYHLKCKFFFSNYCYVFILTYLFMYYSNTCQRFNFCSWNSCFICFSSKYFRFFRCWFTC